MSTIEALVEADERALLRAGTYRLASEFFREPSRVRPEEWRASVGELRESLGFAEHDSARWGHFKALQTAVEASADRERLASDYARLLGHTPRGGATPYGTEWAGAAGEILQFHQLADLCGFYRAFGLELAQGCDERADHISVELSFLHFLCVKESYAEQHALPDLARACHAAQQKFLAAHIAPWMPAFCTRLSKADPMSFYGLAAAFLSHWLDEECHGLAVPLTADPRAPGDSSITLEDCCVSCHQAPSCLSRLTGKDPNHA